MCLADRRWIDYHIIMVIIDCPIVNSSKSTIANCYNFMVVDNFLSMFARGSVIKTVFNAACVMLFIMGDSCSGFKIGGIIIDWIVIL